MKKRFIKRFLTGALALMLAFPSSMVAYATDSITSDADQDAHGELNGKVLYNNDGGTGGTYQYTVSIPTKVYLDKTTKKCNYPVSIKGSLDASRKVKVWVKDDSKDTDGVNIIMKDSSEHAYANVIANVNPYYLEFAASEVKADEWFTRDTTVVDAQGIQDDGEWAGDITFLFKSMNHDSNSHVDANGDGICDDCGQQIGAGGGEVTPPHTCVDANSDGVCDDATCGKHVHVDVNPADGVCDKEGCGYVYGSHQHVYTETGRVEATCTVDGTITKTCVCGDTVTETIPATGHNYVNGSCESCGDADPNHTHDYTFKVTISKEPTCQATGIKKHECVCGDFTEEELPIVDHVYEYNADKDKTACKWCGAECTHEYEDVITNPQNGGSLRIVKMNGGVYTNPGSGSAVVYNENNVQSSGYQYYSDVFNTNNRYILNSAGGSRTGCVRTYITLKHPGIVQVYIHSGNSGVDSYTGSVSGLDIDIGNSDPNGDGSRYGTALDRDIAGNNMRFKTDSSGRVVINMQNSSLFKSECFFNMVVKHKQCKHCGAYAPLSEYN